MKKQAPDSATHGGGDIPLSRRTLLAAAMAGAGLLLVAPARVVSEATPLSVENATRLYTVEVARIVAPPFV